VFDQRGVGLGSPRLACPEGDDPRLWWGLSTDPGSFDDGRRLVAAYAACRARLLAEGNDLGAFTTTQSAADVEALGQSRGLSRVVLIGLSYGTRLALTVMRDHPGHVAAAVLVSIFFVFPANAHEQLKSSACAREVLQALLADPRTRPDPVCLQSLRRPGFLAIGGG